MNNTTINSVSNLSIFRAVGTKILYPEAHFLSLGIASYDFFKLMVLQLASFAFPAHGETPPPSFTIDNKIYLSNNVQEPHSQIFYKLKDTSKPDSAITITWTVFLVNNLYACVVRGQRGY